MDLNTILQKTQKVSEQTTRKREQVQIAYVDRPYDIEEPKKRTAVKKDTEKSNHSFSQKQHKTNINKIQTGYKQGTNWVQNKVQTGYKLGTNWVQGKEENKETGYKLGSESGTELGTNKVQTGYKLGTNWSFSALTGTQRLVVLFVFNECKNHRSKATNPITIEHMSKELDIQKNTIKTTIKRLIKKGCLMRKEFKVGRGGWTTYELPEHVYTEAIKSETGYKWGTNWVQTGYKLGSELGTELGTEAPSSSSNIINKTTTTGKQKNKYYELPQEWQEIDLSDAKENFGFTENHLIQLFGSELSTIEHVKNSIEYFIFDLVNNKKANEIKTSPLAYFMGIMRRVGVYAAPENYESQNERAMKNYLKQQEKIRERKEEVSAKIFMLHFSEWEKGLKREERDGIISESFKKTKCKIPEDVSLRTYFQKNIWPDFENKIDEETS